MQTNSAANSSPASRPPRQRGVAVEQRDAAPARPQPDQQRAADRARGGLPERRDLRQRGLDRDLVQAPQEAAADEQRRRRGRRGGSCVQRIGVVQRDGSWIRSSAATVTAPPQRVRERGADQAGEQPGRMRERRDRDVPAGRVAQRRTPRRLAQHLQRKAGEQRRADPALPAVVRPAAAAARRSRRRRAARPTGRRSARVRARAAGRSASAARPRARPAPCAAARARRRRARRPAPRRPGWRPGAGAL